jgi:hypothetical protein
MKATSFTVAIIATLVFTGTVNAQNIKNTELVKDKTIVKQIIEDSFNQEALNLLDSDSLTSYGLVLKDSIKESQHLLEKRDASIALSNTRTEAISILQTRSIAQAED